LFVSKDSEQVKNIDMTSGIKRVCMSGWSNCGAFKQAKLALTGLSTIFPTDFAVEINERK
jgi:hypothetical protein